MSSLLYTQVNDEVYNNNFMNQYHNLIQWIANTKIFTT